MSTLIRTQAYPGGPIRRHVHREARDSARSRLAQSRQNASPFIARDPFGQRQAAQLAGLADLGIAVVPALSLASNVLGLKSLFGGKTNVAQVKADVAGRTGIADQWKQIMGTVPGRQIGWSNLGQIWMGLNHQGLFPKNNKKGPGGVPGAEEWITAWMNARSEKGSSIPEVVQAALSRGVDNPLVIADTMWNAAQPKNNLWAQFANPTERQIIVDLLDAKIAEVKPSTPVYYPAQAAKPDPAPAAAAPKTTQPVVSEAPFNPTITPAAPLPTQTPGVPPQTAALIDQLLAQGKSQQEAFMAAMQQLQASSSAPIPQALQVSVARDVADSAQQAGTGTAMPEWAKYAALGAGALVLFFTMARPQRGRGGR